MLLRARLSSLWRGVVSGWRSLLAQKAADPFRGLDAAQALLIVGLGNPGPEYAQTRHNVGFMVLDELATRSNARWTFYSDVESEVAAVSREGGGTLILAKPQTFMNRSGDAVWALMNRLGVVGQQVLVIYDDLDLPFGVLRIRQRGSPGTHNGMRSIVGRAGSQDIPRLRIGISQPSAGAAIDHVLGRFDTAEQQAVDELVERAADAARVWAIDGASTAMNRYNKG